MVRNHALYGKKHRNVRDSGQKSGGSQKPRKHSVGHLTLMNEFGRFYCIFRPAAPKGLFREKNPTEKSKM
jgi:hypothetical protein